MWETHPKEKEKPLPAIPPPIYDDYFYFLSGVSAWIEKRAAVTVREGLACEVVRSAQDVWCGVGVYTVCELFFDAGTRPHFF